MKLDEAIKTLKNNGYIVEAYDEVKHTLYHAPEKKTVFPNKNVKPTIFKFTSDSNMKINDLQQDFVKYTSELFYHPLIIEGSLYVAIDPTNSKAKYVVRQLSNQNASDCEVTELTSGSEEYNNIIETFEEAATEIYDREDDRF